MKIKNIIIDIFLYVVLFAVLIVVAFPLIYTVASSFKTNTEILVNPERVFSISPTVENYITAFNSPDFNVGQLLWNSVWYTILNVLIMVGTSTMCGYVFARGKFPFKKIIFTCFSALMFIKTGGIGIYATFQLLNVLHLPQSLWTLLLIHLFSVHIVYIYLVKGYVSSLPTALDEAAKIDGCGLFGTFIHIILPLLKPIVATVSIMAFQNSWNDYIMPTIFTMSRPEQRTFMVGLMALKNSSGAATSWNLMLAGAVIAMLPVTIAYAFGNKYFVKGLADGAVKG